MRHSFPFYLSIIRVFFLIIVVSGCGGGGGGSSSSDLPKDVTALVTTDQGGDITLSDGTSLTIPAGALSEDTEITVRRIAEESYGDDFVAGIQFEPDGLELAETAQCLLPLPASWDGDESPLIYVFNGDDPGNYYYTGDYAQVKGQAGAYMAELPVSHFSGAFMAANCHSGTWDYVLANFAKRGCSPEEAIEAIRAYEDDSGKTPFADLTLPTEDDDYLITNLNGSEKIIQALFETFYNKISSYDVGEELTELSAYLNYARDQAHGRTVLLAFTEGKWNDGDNGFLKEFKHTASLELVNGQVKMRNSVSNPKESNTNHKLAQALIEKNGANVFWYPKEGELTVESLQAFRNRLPIEALEIELCGETGCLCDPALNDYGINLNVTMAQRSRMNHPWTAMNMYVEKNRVNTRPCGEDNLLYASVNIPKHYTDTLVYTAENCIATHSVFTEGDDSLILDGVPTIRGLTGSSAVNFQDMVTITLHPQLSGPGTYTSFGFLVNGINIEIELLTDGVRDNDDSADMVWFQAKTGEVVLEEFGTEIGDVVSGTFDVVIQGNRVTCSGASCEECDDEDCREDVSGTMVGNFYGIVRAYEE